MESTTAVEALAQQFADAPAVLSYRAMQVHVDNARAEATAATNRLNSARSRSKRAREQFDKLAAAGSEHLADTFGVSRSEVDRIEREIPSLEAAEALARRNLDAVVRQQAADYAKLASDIGYAEFRDAYRPRENLIARQRQLVADLAAAIRPIVEEMATVHFALEQPWPKQNGDRAQEVVRAVLGNPPAASAIEPVAEPDRRPERTEAAVESAAAVGVAGIAVVALAAVVGS